MSVMRQGFSFDILTGKRPGLSNIGYSGFPEDDLEIHDHIERNKYHELEKRLNNQTFDYQSKLFELERQLEKQVNASCQNDIDLAREKDRNQDLLADLKQLQTEKQELLKENQSLNDLNNALQTQVDLKDGTISTQKQELDAIRSDFITREQDLIARTSSREKTLSETCLALYNAKAELSSTKLELIEVTEQLQTAKDSECMAKERLVMVEDECASKLKEMAKREEDAILAATSDLESRLRIAEEARRTSEKNEALANSCRHEAEAKVAKLRSEIQTDLSNVKQRITADYEVVLQNKDAELSVFEKCRQADKVLMEEIREKLNHQKCNHKKELDAHAKKVDDLSSALQQTNEDLRQENDCVTSLRLDIHTLQSSLEAERREGQKNEQDWQQEKALLEQNISATKIFLEKEQNERKDEAAHYEEKLQEVRSREQELRDELQSTKSVHRDELKQLERRAASAVQLVFESKNS